MSVKKRKIYTEKDWKKADQIDRLYMHLLEPERWVLTPTDEEKLQRLRLVWKTVVKYNTPRQRLMPIIQAFQVSEREAFRLIESAKELFLDLLDLDYDLELRIMYDRYQQIAAKCKAEEDWDGVRKSMDSAQAVLEKIRASRPAEARNYTAITITNDFTQYQTTSTLPESIEDAIILDEHEQPIAVPEQETGTLFQR